MGNILRVRDLAVEFRVAEGVVRAVDGVSFTIPEGRTVALVGESGSGKTVVSQSIMRILPRPAQIVGGEILFFDPDKPGSFVDICRLGENSREMRAIRGGRISIIFQEPMTSLSPLHTVGDQVSETLLLHRDVDRRTGMAMAADMLRMVGFPSPNEAVHKYPFELSGGLRQRAMIAMAMICRPALLIADEPTTALDVTIQAQILKLMADLQDELDMAMLLITHDLGVVANVADEVVVMCHGKVTERGSVEDIFRDPQHPYLKALLRAVPRFGMADGERLVPLREIKAEAGGHLHARKAAPKHEHGGSNAPLLQVKHITKTFTTRRRSLLGGKPAGQVTAVDDISFSVRQGECLGLVGESGCGKTTTSKIILRATSPDSGELTYNDHGRLIDVLALRGKDLFAFRRKVQFIFQDPFSSLNPRMTVYDLIEEPFVIHAIGDRAERADRVRELMTLVGLDIRYLRRYPHSFSGGQRQRIGIARALALQPELLICDEPVSALDVSVQAQVLNLLKDLQEQLGLTYLFISHNLAVVDYMADRIAVMCAGRLVETAAREELFENPVHPYTRALLAAVPKANPGAKLDLSALMEGKASEPAAWPAPFTLNGGVTVDMIDIGNGHFVRAATDASL
jgi:peptide/nickel transport system ATP-binding protein